MKNFYSFLKLSGYIKSIRIKHLGIFLLYILRKRYIGVFLDPVFACNLRCKMCYFSDPEKRKQMAGGKFQLEDLEKIANAFFHRALKLQIGCGAEPSLFSQNKELILLGKEKKVPYISMTTNANLLSKADIQGFIEAGLDEITLSTHGVKKETYEYFMEGASFEKFCSIMDDLSDLKKQYPHFKIRVNYTVNKDNLEELSGFFDVFGKNHIDILQLRPIQNIGNSKYNDFSWDEIYSRYDSIIQKLKDISKEKGITCIAPGKNNLIENSNQNDSSLTNSTYCYISPKTVWEDDFDLSKDTFESYAKRSHLGRKLFLNIFRKKKNYAKKKGKLNYKVS